MDETDYRYLDAYYKIRREGFGGGVTLSGIVNYLHLYDEPRPRLLADMMFYIDGQVAE